MLKYQRNTVLPNDLPHPFVQNSLPSVDGATVFCSPAAGALHLLVIDHVVHGRAIFPGAGYLEMVRAAAGNETALRSVFFVQPLVAESQELLVECIVRDRRFEVRSSGSQDVWTDTVVHCSGSLAAAAEGQRRAEHVQLGGHFCTRAAPSGVLYDCFDGIGLQYGPGYRTLVQAWHGAGMATARLRARATQGRTAVHPADLDDALCVGALGAQGSEGEGGTRLPFAVDEARLQSSVGGLWAVRRWQLFRCLVRLFR